MTTKERLPDDHLRELEKENRSLRSQLADCRYHLADMTRQRDMLDRQCDQYQEEWTRVRKDRDRLRDQLEEQGAG